MKKAQIQGAFQRQQAQITLATLLQAWGPKSDQISFQFCRASRQLVLPYSLPVTMLWEPQTHTGNGVCLSSRHPWSASLCSVQFSRSVVSDSLWPHGLQHARPPCPSPTPGVYSNSCPLSRWCHPTISSSVVPFSSHLQSFPASGSFPWVGSSDRETPWTVAGQTPLSMGILQAWILEWVAISFFRGSSWPRDQTCVS